MYVSVIDEVLMCYVYKSAYKKKTKRYQKHALPMWRMEEAIINLARDGTPEDHSVTVAVLHNRKALRPDGKLAQREQWNCRTIQATCKEAGVIHGP